jgi:hypothetical protein
MEGWVRAGGVDTLVGTSQAHMRRVSGRIIDRTPGHPLTFLRDGAGDFHPTRGLSHAELADSSNLIQMGHITSNKLGGVERVMLQDAWENQINNITIEMSHLGGAVLSQDAVSIGGIAVSERTALMWEGAGRLPPGTVAAAPRVDLGFSRIAPGPAATGATGGTLAADARRRHQTPSPVLH